MTATTRAQIKWAYPKPGELARLKHNERSYVLPEFYVNAASTEDVLEIVHAQAARLVAAVPGDEPVEVLVTSRGNVNTMANGTEDPGKPFFGVYSFAVVDGNRVLTVSSPTDEPFDLNTLS